MRMRGLRLRNLRALRARAAVLALLVAGLRPGVALVCNDNEQHNDYSLVKCTPCGVGKYGIGGKCYDCPFFARKRKDRDVAGTLWCDNRCEQIWDNRLAVTDVEFAGIKTRAEAEQSVLHIELVEKPYDGFGNVDSTFSRSVMCKKCAGQTFMQQITAFRFEMFRTDLLAMNFAESDINSLNAYQIARFKWNLCRSCPPGFVRGSWSVPEDVRTMSGDSALSIPVDPKLVIPCKACSVREGVPQVVAGAFKCSPCLNRMYQLARMETFVTHVKMEKPRFVDELTALVVGISCQHCPPGFQAMQAYGAEVTGDAFWVGGQCRGSEQQCCSKCPVNQFKEKSEGVCVNALKNQVVLSDDNFVLSGGVRERACGSGERLTFCTDGGCDMRAGWRTCLPCSLDETTFAGGATGATSGCAACDPAKRQHLVDKNNSKQCAECDLCSELSVVRTPVLLNTLPMFTTITSEYSVTRAQASCTPLKQRRLEKVNGALVLAGDAHWREPSKAQGEPLPAHHFLDRAGGCQRAQKAPCAGRCQTPFKFSEGCGNSAVAAKTWVRSPGPQSVTKRLSDVLPAEVADVADAAAASTWTVLSEGHCQFCTFCIAGEHNEGCDQQPQYVLGKPEGECKACKTICPKGEFLWHSEKEAGCHEPPAHQNVTDGSGKFAILEDYTCTRCPTWVRQGQNLSIVAACGLHAAGDTYEHFSAEVVNQVLQKTAKPVEAMPRGEELIGTNPRKALRKNFRGFMHNLKNYCPQNYFFDSAIPNCNFIESGEPLALPGSRTVLVGYDAYRPACCAPCKSCAGATSKKDMSSWRQCMGDSVEDVQDRCVAKCVLGYWEATGPAPSDEKTCRRCSTCFEGVV